MLNGLSYTSNAGINNSNGRRNFGINCKETTSNSISEVVCQGGQKVDDNNRGPYEGIWIGRNGNGNVEGKEDCLIYINNTTGRGYVYESQGFWIKHIGMNTGEVLIL